MARSCLTGGAGLRAMNRACEEVVGHADALDGIPVAGRTDWIILADASRAIGRALDGDAARATCERPIRRRTCAEEISSRATGVKAVMPGIRELLDALAAARATCSLGLLTGNFEASARIKLEHFDLWRYFRCGAFGDDAADRNALVPFARRARARVRHARRSRRADVLVVGDTPHDVACAHAAGAMPSAWRPAGSRVEELRGRAARPSSSRRSAIPTEVIQPTRPG